MPTPASLNVLIYVTAIIFGLVMGSFLNVLIYRIPRKLPFIQGTSFCPGCGARVMPYDLVPVLSYIVLGGKCRKCRSQISIIYPAIELLTGGLAAAAVWRYGLSAAVFAGFAVMAVLVVIAMIDVAHMEIPNGLVIALLVVGVAYAVTTRFFPVYGSSENIVIVKLWEYPLGAVVVSLPMLVLAMVIKDAFGGGDIKLMAVCGLFLGFRLVLVAAFAAFFLGGLHGILIKLFSKTGKRHMPFGQYICVGTALAMMCGGEAVAWYLGLFSLG